MLVLQAAEDPTQKLPASLMRRYDVVIRPRSSVKPLKMREIKAASIGHLVTMRVSTPQCHTQQWSRTALAPLNDLLACYRGNPVALHCCTLCDELSRPVALATWLLFERHICMATHWQPLSQKQPPGISQGWCVPLHGNTPVKYPMNQPYC